MKMKVKTLVCKKKCKSSNYDFWNKKLNEDISVPRSKLPVALDGIYKIGEKYGFQVPCFGHAGDGNIHVNVMVKRQNKCKRDGRWT